MNFSNYLLSKTQRFDATSKFPEKAYDVFISVYNTSERVTAAFNQVNARRKIWIVLPEYGVAGEGLDGEIFVGGGFSEDEVIGEILKQLNLTPSLRVCIDSTGFLRPHLLYSLAWLNYHSIRKYFILYTNPISYKKGSETIFSEGGSAKEVRQIYGYEGIHSSDTNKEFLIVGCGYDANRVIEVNKDKARSRKVKMFSFPPLRPHMYQESRIRIQACDDSFGDPFGTIFSPAEDPFATADALSRFYNSYKNKISNLYLSPLSTKAQVVGFGIFYLNECQGKAVSIIYPFVNAYNPDTSDGVSNFWEYHVNLDLYI